MSCPCPMLYPPVFDPVARPMVVAALLSADVRGVIAPADGQRWFSRDMNEIAGRRWAVPYLMRVDRMFSYRLTDDGRAVADVLRNIGQWSFDGWDAWCGDSVVLPDHVVRSAWGMPGTGRMAA